MKVKKRVLSAVLAATMLVTSLSAGLSALAASTDDYQALADALKADGVVNATWDSRSQTGSDKDGHTEFRVTMDDPTGDIEAAAEAFWAIASDLAPSHTTAGEDSDYNTLLQVKNEILEQLQNGNYGVDMSVATAALYAFTAGQEGADKGEGWLGTKVPNNRNYIFQLNRGNFSDQLMEYATVDEIPNTLYGTVEYDWYHNAYTLKDSWGAWERNLYLQSWERRETNPNTAIPAALKTFGAYFTDELLGTDLSTLNGDELKQRLDDAQAQVDALAALNLWGNDAVMNHFFDKEAIEVYIDNVEATIDVAYARDYVADLQELMVNDPAAMEHDALNTLYSDLNALRTSLQGLNQAAVNTALTEAGLTWDAVNAYIDSVYEEIEVDNLEGYKAVIDQIVISLPEDLTTVEDGTTLQADYATLTTQMALVNECSAGAIGRVFPDGTDYVTAAIDRLNIELQRRELLNDALGFGAYFAPKTDDDLTAVATNDLINNYRTPDLAKFAEVQAYEPEALDAVYGEGWYDSVVAYIDSIDATLTARIEAQIDEAVNNYQEFGQITILNYKEFKAAYDGVETQILDVITLSEDYQDKYDSLKPMLDQYTEFVNSKGLSSWQKGPVEYPTREIMAGDVARVEGEEYEVTAEKLDTVINSLDGLMQNPEVGNLLAGLGVTGIEGAISDLLKNAISGLYTQDVINALVGLLYPMVCSQVDGYKSIIDIIGGLGQTGLYIYPEDLADRIDSARYPDVYNALKGAGDNWDAILVGDGETKSANLDWGFEAGDRDAWVNALGNSLRGIEVVVRALLTNYNHHWDLNILIASANLDIPAVNGYEKSLLPLMELLGCENLMSVAEYNALDNTVDLIANLLNPLLDWVEEICSAPVSNVLELLPKLAYMMEFDMIHSVLNQILGLTISLKGGGLASSLNMTIVLKDLLDVDSMLANAGIDLNNGLNGLIDSVLNVVAPGATLVLPTIDQAYLASLGTLEQSANGNILYHADKPAVLLAVLRYVLGMVGDADFMDALFALIGQMTGSEIALGDDVMDIITGLGTNPDGVICALTELFVPREYAAQEYTYKYVYTDEETGEPLPVNTVEYSENWTKEEAQYIADNLDEFVDNMMTILGGADMPGLGDLIRSYIADEFYTNEMINTIVITVRDALNGIGIDLAPILDLVDVDLSSWNSVTESTNWGVVPGDSVTFAAGLSQALSPLTPVLAFLLTGQDISVLGTITANGYNGYQNGIVPLLENLGCNTAYIHSYDEYVARVNQDPSRALNDILTPILNLVDRIYQNPIDTIIDILPNLLYFIDCGGLTTAIKNVAQSAFVLLDTVRPIYNISFDLNFNLQQILVDLLANLEVGGQKLNLKIPFLNDLSLLMVGTVTPYDSKSDLQPYYMLMNTDKADFVTVLMRNVVDLLFYQENQKVITDLIANQAGLDQETADSLLEIFNTFATMYQEDNGVDKILHAAYVIFHTTHETAGGALTDIKDFNERWSAVFETLQSQGGFLADFADWADGVLDFLSFGLITGDGVGTSGLIDFFERLVAFFQGKITDVSIDRTSADMLVGEQTTLSLSFKPVTVKNKNAAWTSSNERVATVENGVVTAVGVGDTEIKATTEDGGFVVSCVVRVRANKADLNAAIAKVEGTTLTEDQLAQINGVLAAAKEVAANELASQDSVNEACAALLDAFNALDLGTPVTDVTITQNGSTVGEVVYQKVKWTKKWNSTPVTLGVQINGGELSLDDVKRVSWEYADWSVDKPEADIEPNGMEATIRAKNSVIGAHSCWIQVTVEDAYGNTVTSNPVKVRFYNYDWQK